MAHITINVNITTAIRRRLDEVNSPGTMTALHNALAKHCDPYVPFRTGALAQTNVVTPKGVTYIQPYARYQYYGEIYGPNIPILGEDGDVEGWWSPPGKKKKPTGRQMKHNTEYHPLATSYWDRAMLRDHRDEFNQEVQDIINWRLHYTNKW